MTRISQIRPLLLELCYERASPKGVEGDDADGKGFIRVFRAIRGHP